MKNKELKSGNIIVEVPYTYEVFSEDSTMFGNFISCVMVVNKKSNIAYFFYEIKMKSEPKYLMEYSVSGAMNRIATSTEWGEMEDAKFNSYDACKRHFTTIINDDNMNGVAYAFHDGKSRSYEVIALYKGEVPDNDPILQSFHLAENTDPEVTFKDAGDEMQHFIEQIRPVFGQEISEGLTMDKIEVTKEKKELTYTLQLNSLSKALIDPTELNAMKAEMSENLPNAIKEMAASQLPLMRCMEEGYTIIYKITDKNDNLLFSLSSPPDKYR